MSGFGHLGTGREKTGGPGDGLNNSYPYVAVNSLSDVAAKTGMVFSHPISASLVNDARPINEAVGARREDKRVLVQHGTSGGADPRHPGRVAPAPAKALGAHARHSTNCRCENGRSCF